MTLVEIMAALALLSTLLVMMLVARSDHLRQWRKAQDRLAAVAMADQLLSQWWLSEAGIPRQTSGAAPVSQSPQGYKIALRWRTLNVESEQAQELQCQLIRLEIHLDLAMAHEEPLVFVELLLPIASDGDVSPELSDRP